MTTANLAINDNDTVVQYTSTGESIFTYDFPILDEDELKVSVDAAAQILGVDYTVTGVGDEGGGTIVFGAATTAGELITIWQDMDMERLTGFSTGAAVLLPEALNTEFARQVRQDQQIRRDNGRALRLPIDDTVGSIDMELPYAASRLGKFLRFADADGAPELSELLISATVLSQSVIAGYLWPQTAAEISAGVTPTNLQYQECNILRYGADRTGAVPADGAIRDAVAVAEHAKITGNAGVWGALSTTSGVAPVVYFPYGIYTITAPLTSLATGHGLSYTQFIGDRAVLVDTTLAVNCFEAIAYDTLFRGLILRGFDKQIVIDTNNVNRAKIDIIECGLIDPATNCLETSTDSNSTILNVQRCNISNSGAAVVAFDCLVDHMTVRDSWLQIDSDVAFINRDDLKLYNNVLVPSGVNTGRVWVENRGVSLEAGNNIFGGEGAGRVFVDHYTAMDAAGTINPVWISLHDFEGYSNNEIVKLNTLPNHLKLDSIYDDAPTTAEAGIWVAAGITAQELEDYARHGTVDLDERWPRSRVINNPTVAAMMQIKNLKGRAVNRQSNRIDEALVLASGDTNTANWVGTATAGETAETNSYGADRSVYTATADDQSCSISDTDFLVRADLALEPLTHCHEITWEPAGLLGNMELLVTVGNEAYYLPLLPGTHMYSFPFVYLNGGGAGDDTTLDNIQLQSGGRMLNGDVIKFGRWYLLQGVHFMSSINLEMIAAATPSAIAGTTGSNQAYYPGDEWHHSAPAAATSPGEICVTEGDPGTWKARAALAA